MLYLLLQICQNVELFGDNTLNTKFAWEINYSNSAKKENQNNTKNKCKNK